jgi:hypothetical protein
MEIYVEQILKALGEHVPADQKEVLWVKLMTNIGSAQGRGIDRIDISNEVSRRLHAGE